MSLKITGAEQLYRNIDKVAKWSVKDSQSLQAVGHRVGAAKLKTALTAFMRIL